MAASRPRSPNASDIELGTDDERVAIGRGRSTEGLVRRGDERRDPFATNFGAGTGLPVPGGMRRMIGDHRGHALDHFGRTLGDRDRLRQLDHAVHPGRVRDTESHALRTDIACQLDAGFLHARSLPKVPRAPVSYDDSLGNDDPFTPGNSEPALAWIVVRLTDPEGQPIAGEKYVVVDSNGDEYRGELDDAGQARHDDIARGPARVCFPDIDRGDWRLASQPDDDDEVALAIDIRVHDEDDTPAGGLGFELALADGPIRGTLDGRGTTRHEPVPPGDAEFRLIDV